MKTTFADEPIRPLPHHLAVIGAAGGLGQGILDVCRTEGIGFTAIVRSRPERITNVPRDSQIAVVPSFTDCSLLREAFSGADAVLTALGVTSTSHDRSALLSANMATLEEAMLASQVNRILMINTLLAAKPGRTTSRAMRFFSLLPGRIGRGATEQQAVADAGTFARSVGPLYTAMCNHANRYDGSVVPELHVTDLVKFRGPTAATSWTEGLADTMLRASIECLYDEYLAIAPPIILLVDWAIAALSDRDSPLYKTSALRLSWRSDPNTAHLDSLLSKIAETGRPVPFWGKATRHDSWAPSRPDCTVTLRVAPDNPDPKLTASVHPEPARSSAPP